jgi:hypothetical protein
MDYKENIIHYLADRECQKICRKTILTLQKMTEGMQSGEDTPLKNIWDEVCVQIQSQYSLFWDAYLDTLFGIIVAEVRNLEDYIMQAIWLQTKEALYWEDSDEEIGNAPYSEEDITEHILHEYVLSKAADWSNANIREYLDE